ncbi:hypothetical protein DPMN_183742 [Dreissena polymorpha]|uniref:Uncharacterized protein n=1 Tax=Dreissena polymorpha TaxID=45954 RepID=A0A9D4DH68_DREPO|nr:hypothetical protein DPMN_183742 [Dreissena polymorpha]
MVSLQPISKSSSVELVSHADGEDQYGDHNYVRHRMESLDFKPGRYSIVMPPFEEKGVYSFCTVRQSVCQSVTLFVSAL